MHLVLNESTNTSTLNLNPFGSDKDTPLRLTMLGTSRSAWWFLGIVHWNFIGVKMIE